MTPCNCDQALQLAARVAELEAEVHTWRTNRLHGGCLEDLMAEVGRRAEVESERDTARAEAAAMREAFLEYIRICGPTADHHPDDCDVAGGCEYCRTDARANAVLASGAGSALLERLRSAESEVEWLRSLLPTCDRGPKACDAEITRRPRFVTLSPVGTRVSRVFVSGVLRDVEIPLYPMAAVERGEKLRELRISLDLNLRQAAALIGITAAELSALQCGEVAVSETDWQMILAALGAAPTGRLAETAETAMPAPQPAPPGVERQRLGAAILARFAAGFEVVDLTDPELARLRDEMIAAETAGEERS